jgi:hypothetical protein
MTGIQILEQYLSKRDYSGSEADEYAQFLITLVQAGDPFFDLLVEAENSGKKLALIDEDVDEVVAGNIMIV